MIRLNAIRALQRPDGVPGQPLLERADRSAEVARATAIGTCFDTNRARRALTAVCARCPARRDGVDVDAGFLWHGIYRVGADTEAARAIRTKVLARAWSPGRTEVGRRTCPCATRHDTGIVFTCLRGLIATQVATCDFIGRA